MRKYLLLVLAILFLVGCFREEIDIHVDWVTYPDLRGIVDSTISIQPCSYIPFPKKCGGGANYAIGSGFFGKSTNSHKTTSYINYFYLQGKLKGTVKYFFRGKECGGGEIESNGSSPVEFKFECIPKN